MKAKAGYGIFLILFSGMTLSAQGLLSPGLSMVDVKQVLGLSADDAFALVYKKDTLVSFYTQPNGWRSQLFEETLETEIYADSLVQRYKSSAMEKIIRLLLPDSVKVYEWTREKDGPLKIERWDSLGRELWRVDSTRVGVATTFFYPEGKETTTLREEGYSLAWEDARLDSTYSARFSTDSILESYHWSSKPTKQLRQSYSFHQSPFSESFYSDFHSPDSTYSYSKNWGVMDTTIRTSIVLQFPGQDSTYSLMVEVGTKDSIHEVTHRTGRNHFVKRFSATYGTHYQIEQGALYVLRDFNPQGDLVYFEKTIEGPVGAVSREILRKGDTFSHQLSYYHQIRWENDSDNITLRFPYARQLFFDEDSNVTKEVSYHFDQAYRWPEIEVTEGDSSWVIDRDSSAKSNFRIQGYICPGPVVNGVGYASKRDSLYLDGITSPEVNAELRDAAKESQFFGYGFDPPPFYLIFSSRPKAGYSPFATSLPMHSPHSRGRVKEILKAHKASKAILYVNGRPQKFRGFLIRIHPIIKTNWPKGHS